MNPSTCSFRARGKLLLSGEYFVLDGALSLAVPTKQGQSLHVEEQEDFAHLSWESLDAEGETWFKGLFDIEDFALVSTTDAATAERLQQILRAVRAQNEGFLPHGAIVRTELEFPREWGLGTSSTLLYNLAQWAEVDAYRLLFDTFGGSGYDLACAGAESAIFYRLEEKERPKILPFPFQPAFLDKLYFVYLEKKQNSREGIARYREKVKSAPELVKRISTLTEEIARADSLAVFEEKLKMHEEITAETLELPRAKDLYFPDFAGEIKSLGAWGGDFVLATSALSAKETAAYFAEKGMGICLGYGDLIL